MRETFYIRLGSGAPDEIVEFAISEANVVRGLQVQRATLEDALVHAVGRRIIALVPGDPVRLTTVAVPAKQPAKILQATPYLLEEQLSEDIDTLHFALGATQPDGRHAIAVVAKSTMQNWLRIFQQRDLRPAALIPETLSLPWDATTPRWSALVEPAHVTVRNGATSGFCCDPADLLLYLQMADPEKTQTLRLLLPGLSPGDYTGLDWPLELLPGFGSALEALVAHLQIDHAINLLQGSYSQRQDLDRLWRPWRVAAILAAAWLAISGIAFGIDTWQLNRALKQQEEANLQKFQQLFPTETRVVDIDAQLDQQMRRLKSGSGGGNWFALLETLTQALSANAGLQIQSLQFRDGALFLSLKGSDLQVLEKLRGWFASQRGVKLEVQSANAGSEGVQIRLKLSRA